jgi:hypothetical protein
MYVHDNIILCMKRIDMSTTKGIHSLTPISYIATLYAILIIFNGATVEANKTHKICNVTTTSSKVRNALHNREEERGKLRHMF